MISACLDQQLIVTVDNEVGTLAEVSGVVASSQINLIAVCAYAVDNKGVIMFVSEDNKAAAALLKEHGYDVRSEEVILLSLHNRPGALQCITRKIADAGVDMTLLYGSVDKRGKTSNVVIVSEDNTSALMAIQVKN